MKLPNHATSCAIALLAAACGDAQATPSYQGEALMTIQGSIETAPGAALGEGTVPVLAWLPSSRTNDGEDFDKVWLSDVRVEGTFPTSFSLSVDEPPPDDALYEYFAPRPGEPRLALAMISAVPREHEASTFIGASIHIDNDECVAETQECTSRITFCDHEGECYREVRVCEGDKCTTTHEGRPRIKYGLGQFQGMVESYVVLYLDGPAAADTLTAYFFTGGQALSEGFHLLKLRPRSQAEEEAVGACREKADAVAARRYAKETGMSLSDVEAQGDGDLELETFRVEAERERHCDNGYSGEDLEAIATGHDHPVTMILGDDIVLQ